MTNEIVILKLKRINLRWVWSFGGSLGIVIALIQFLAQTFVWPHYPPNTLLTSLGYLAMLAAIYALLTAIIVTVIALLFNAACRLSGGIVFEFTRETMESVSPKEYSVLPTIIKPAAPVNPLDKSLPSVEYHEDVLRRKTR